MIKTLNCLIRILTRLRNKLKGDKGNTSHKNWIKGYNEWKKSYK